MNIKLALVAERTGFSVSTVSRALSGSPSVNGNTRHKIQKIYDRLQSHAISRVNSPQLKPKLLGLFTRMTSRRGSQESALLREVEVMQEKAGAAGYGVMLAPYNNDKSDSVADTMLDDGLLTGVILLDAKIDDPIITRLIQKKLPFIRVHHFSDDNPYHCVGIDDSLAVQKMVKHLVHRGYREIAFLGASRERLPQQQKREGFLAELAACGIEPNPEWILSVKDTSTDDETRQEICRLLSMPHRPHAILASTDHLAANAIDAAHELKFNVPHDIAVTGFDNRRIATTTTPRLTTIHVPWNEMVMIATNQLIQLIDCGSYIEQIKIKLATKLIIRESS